MALATIWTHGPTADRTVDEERAEGFANLHLIAAAPELYEAALLAFERLEWTDPQGCEVYDALATALAKARGGA
jgi:hypothetical protein